PIGPLHSLSASLPGLAPALGGANGRSAGLGRGEADVLGAEHGREDGAVDRTPQAEAALRLGGDDVGHREPAHPTAVEPGPYFNRRAFLHDLSSSAGWT